MPAPIKTLLCALLLGVSVLQADHLSCESSPAVEAAQRQLDHQLEGATFEQGLALREAAYRRFLQLDPTDYRPIRDYLSSLRYDEPEKFAAVREKAARDAGETPVQLITSEMVLAGKDTPQAFRIMDRLAEKYPDYAPTYIQRAGLYDRAGKYADKAKAAQAIEKFYQLCPSSRDWRPLRYLQQMGSNDLRKSVAHNLRLRLAASTDPNFLRSYASVWSLEFSTMPIAEHPKERQQVAADLDRLQKLPNSPSAEWLDFLKGGYKQSGASDAQVKSVEDRIAKEFPQSAEAFSLWYESWKDQHPEPGGEATASDWQTYMRLALAHYREIPARFPQQHGFGYYSLEYSANLEGVPDPEIIRAGDAYVSEGDLYDGPSTWTREAFVGTLVRRNLEPKRGLLLMQEARRLKDLPLARVMLEVTDYAKPKEIEDAEKNAKARDASFNLLYLEACRAAADKAAAEQLKGSVEVAAPTEPMMLSTYWNSRAVLAEIEGRTIDALAFYQKALFTREPPKPRYGKTDDVLLADAQRLWTASQGSESAFAIWSQPDKSTQAALADGRWEKPDKDLPAFELSDLQGKTWKLTALEGKKVLINVWATWCGPCQEELPRLQKLYEATKNRSDVAIITLNFDEDQGLIEPFVKKKGYTFPVLPAYSLLSNKIDVNSIPRNWLVGASGKWLWEQIGFGSGEGDWEKSMLSRLEAMP